MRRRDLILGAAALTGYSHAAGQQPPTQARLRWLAHGDTLPRHFFDEALARLGWVEGKNLIVERRFSGSAGERETSAAAELVASPSAKRLA
jgi:putative ABC transport system substrate-binding protein